MLRAVRKLEQNLSLLLLPELRVNSRSRSLVLDGLSDLVYNMYNKTADKEGYSFPFRRNQLTVTISKLPGLCERTGRLTYFSCSELPQSVAP